MPSLAQDYSSIEHPMQGIKSLWMQKIRDAQKVKAEKFGNAAKEAMQFFDGAHDFMWKSDYAKKPGGFMDKDATGAMPTFRMTVNKVFESVALFGPVLYSRNPNVMVTPKQKPEINPALLGFDMNDPQMQEAYQQFAQQLAMDKEQKTACAAIKQHYLDWLQFETNKKSHAQMAINEAIIKGMGILWIEMKQPPGSNIKFPEATYVSVDDIVMDPDAEYWEDVQWVARKCCHPVWQVEREYGLNDGMIRGSMTSMSAQSSLGSNSKEANSKKRSGKSFDLLEYWQVYSKAGFGDRLKPKSDLKGVKRNYDFSGFGDFTYLAISDDVPFPLNLPSHVLGTASEEELFMRAQWPIPFYTDGGWPFARLHFYDKPKCVWPISLIRPAIGELRFVNWCMSFLADKVAASCSTYVAILKRAGVEIQDQITKGGLGPYTHLEISELMGNSISEVVSFLDAPSFNPEIWRMVAEVMNLIDKRTGLTELIYGLSGTQMRSATEADVRNQNVSVRPDHMASQVEDWLSMVSMKEMEAARWMLEADDVAPVLGPAGTYVWENYVLAKDVDTVVRDYDYRIEAGSARKPNKTNRIRQLNDFGQNALPIMHQFVQMGITGPYNAFMQDWAKANDMDASRYLIELPPPEQNQGPSPEEVEMQLKQQEAQLDAQVKMQDAQLDQQRHQQEMGQDQQEHKQELKQDKEKFDLEMQLLGRKGKLEQQLMRTRAQSNGNGSS